MNQSCAITAFTYRAGGTRGPLLDRFGVVSTGGRIDGRRRWTGMVVVNRRVEEND